MTLGIGCVGGEIVNAGVQVFARSGAQSPPFSQRLVDNNSGEPGRELGASLKLCQLPERVHIRLLHSVFRVRVAAEDRACCPVQPLVVPTHQHLECVALAGEHSRDGLFIGIR
jgi:hypothetical protein